MQDREDNSHAHTPILRQSPRLAAASCNSAVGLGFQAAPDALGICLLLLVLPLAASAQNPQVAQGGSATLSPVGSDGPAYGANWDIVTSAGTAIADSNTPNGWTAAPIGKGGSSISISAPSSATVAVGDEVRVYDIMGAGSSISAYFDVVSGGGGGGSASLSTLTLSPSTVVSAQTSTGTVALSAASSTDTTVSLSSSNASLATVPATVIIPAGSISQTFTVTAGTVASQSIAQISATYSGTTLTQNLTINPASAASLSTLTLSPGSIIGAQSGGTTTTGTVTLSAPAPASGVVVSLTSDHTSLVALPATVTIPADSSSNTFTVTAGYVPYQTTVQISAIYNSATLTQTLTVNPWLNSFTVTPSGNVVGGASLTGTITLNAQAVGSGLGVTIASSDPSVTAPSGTDGDHKVTVPTGQSSVTFTMATSAVAVSTPATVTATYGSQSLSQYLTIVPLLGSLSISPYSVTGGTSAYGTVHLNGPAPSATVINLSKGASDPVSVPASVTIPANSTDSQQFAIATSAVQSVANSVVTASYAGASVTCGLAVNPIQISSVSLDPSQVVGGNPSTGTVTLSGAAPPGGVTVTLSSSDPSVALPDASVTVPEGQTSAPFNVTTSAVSYASYINIQAGYGGLSNYGYLTVTPLLESVALDDNTVVGGGTVSGTVTLYGAAPPGGDLIALNSDSDSATVTPVSVTIPAGQNTATFQVSTSPVAQEAYANITASDSESSVETWLDIEPLLAYMTLDPYSIYSGGISQGTIVLNAEAPPGGVTIVLSSSDTTVATVPASVTVPSGSSISPSFTITAQAVATNASTIISGTYNSTDTVQANLYVQPLLSSVSISPNPVISGGSATGTVNLSGTAPSDITVTLASDNPSAATVPASMVIYAGQSSGTFPVAAQAVTVSSAANISASYGGATQSTRLSVVPLIASVSLNPSKVVGGDPSVATVSFNIPAPAGVSLTLTSSNPAATFPDGSTLSVSQGSYNATFNIATTAVASETPVTITVSYGGVSQTAILTIEPMPTLAYIGIHQTHYTNGIANGDSTDTLTGGQNGYANVTLTGIAPAAGITVTLSSSDHTLGTVPETVTVAGGQTYATFNVTTFPVAVDSTGLVTGTYGTANVSQTLYVDRPRLVGFTFDQGSTAGGSTDVATLELDGPAPEGGFTVQMSETPTGAAAISGATLPTTVTIAYNTTTGTAPVQMSTVNTPVTLTFTAQAVEAGSVPITGGESLTATVGLVLSTLHAADLLMPKAIQLQWNVTAVGNFLLYRDGVQIATLGNTMTAYTDAFNWTSGQTYKYDIYDDNSNPKTLLSSEQAIPYLEPAIQDQAVDSRLDPRYSANVLLDHAFGSAAYKGGLFAGFASDPSRVGRSFAQFNLNSQPSNGVFRTGKVNAYFVTGYTDNGPVNVTVGCQTIANNAWSAPSLTWDTAPTPADFNPAGTTNTTAIQYDPSVPGGLTATGGNGQVSLAWVPPNTQKTVASYTVWYGPYPGYYNQSITGVAETSATVTGLTNDTTYYFVVQAVYADGTTTGNSPSVSATPPTVLGTSVGPNVWCSWDLGGDILAAIQGGHPLYSVAWASTNETQQGWVYFAKTEYGAALGPNVIDLWSIPTLVRLDVPQSIAISDSGTGIVTVNGIGLQGSAVVQLSSSNASVATVPDSITVTGLNRNFAITPHGVGSAIITASLGGVSIQKSITVQ